MTYWILKDNGYVIARISARPKKEEKIHSETEKQARKEFQEQLKQHVSNFD
jgi:hypothetical protein